MTQALLWAIAVLAGGGGILLVAGRWLPARWGGLAALSVGIGAWVTFLVTRSDSPEVVLFPWIPAENWPISVVYRFDALAWAFALLAVVPALLLLCWMGGGAAAEEGHFAPWILVLLALFLHLILSADLVVAYASWEILLLATYWMLTYRRSALPTPGIAEWFLGGQHVAGYLLLLALLWTGLPVGSGQYVHLNRGTTEAVVLLLMLGTAWVRTAQVPFQGWAVAAAESPGAVSTLLLGGWGLLVGPYLWLRFLSLTGESGPYEVALIAGSVSLIVGAALALRQESARQVLAGDTVSRLGLVWVALGLGGPLGIAAGLFLLLDLLGSKAVFHLALAGNTGLDRPVRQGLFALGMWGAVGLPPSVGFVGRWLLALGLIQAGRAVYLPVVLLAGPFALAYLWRGWTLVPAGSRTFTPIEMVVQRIVAGVVALFPLTGATALGVWSWFFEQGSRVVLRAEAAPVRPLLESLLGWVPVWMALLLLAGSLGIWWMGARPRRAGMVEDGTAGPLQELPPTWARETIWLAWLGRPTPLYGLFTRLIVVLASALHRLVTFLERHTTYLILVVLIAATIVLIVLTR